MSARFVSRARNVTMGFPVFVVLAAWLGVRARRFTANAAGLMAKGVANQLGSAYGNRTHLSALRGPRPEPIDERATREPLDGQ